jgi:GT2 family glycosyltransferase
MAVRREIFPVVHGFDPSLGAGAVFFAGEETDLILRALAQGIAVAETPDVEVTHHGFRAVDATAEMVERYLYGTGATYGKHARLHPLPMAKLLLRVAFRFAMGDTGVNYGRASRKGFRLAAFSRGFARGFVRAVDPATGWFAG